MLVSGAVKVASEDVVGLICTVEPVTGGMEMGTPALEHWVTTALETAILSQ